MGLLKTLNKIAGSPLTSVIGDVVGGLLTDKGTAKANKANIKLAREQMAFQERMSSTAYQRAARDMEAAGLNRILALGSPASSPSGALPLMKSESAGLGAAAASAPASAIQARTARANLQFINEQTRKTALDAEVSAELRQKVMAEIENIRTSTEVNSATAVMEKTKAAALEYLLRKVGDVTRGGDSIEGILGAIGEMLWSVPSGGSSSGTTPKQTVKPAKDPWQLLKEARERTERERKKLREQ